LFVTAQTTQRYPSNTLGSLKMAKAGKDSIEMDGIVTDALPNAMFRVELEANKQVNDRLCTRTDLFIVTFSIR
jgi:hypothetical protein